MIDTKFLRVGYFAVNNQGFATSTSPEALRWPRLLHVAVSVRLRMPLSGVGLRPRSTFPDRRMSHLRQRIDRLDRTARQF